MTYIKKLRRLCRHATIEYVPAARVLHQFTETELADRPCVVNHLRRVGLPEMSNLLGGMPRKDYDLFVQNIEDTSDEDTGFH